MCYNVKTEESVLVGLWNKSNLFQNAFCDPFMSLLCSVEATKILRLQEDLSELSSNEILKKFDLSNGDIEDITIRCICENIKNQVCQMNILSLSPIITRDKMREFKVKGIVFVRGREISQVKKLIDEFDKDIRLGIAIDPLLDGDEITNQVSDLCGKYNLPVLVTLFDDLDKTGKLDSMFDMTPTRYIESVGLFDRECYIYGGIHADKDDFEIWSSYNAKAIVSPSTFLYLGKGIANIQAMINAGVEVRLSSYLENNIPTEIRMALLLARGTLNDAGLFIDEEAERLAYADKPSEVVSRYCQKSFDNCQKILEKIKRGCT